MTARLSANTRGFSREEERGRLVYSRCMEAGREILLLDWKYSAWATRRLLDACARLTVEERTRDLGLPHGSVLSTFDHIFRSEEFWGDCLVANEMPPMDQIG